MIAMKTALMIVALALGALVPTAQGRETFDTPGPGGGTGHRFAPLQCVPYARDVSGIRIYGDAHTWWGQAQGRYRRGSVPRVGAVMAIRPFGNSRLGHVAAVSRIIDPRTILVRHANWSSPGEIENNVRAVDVSPANDWSEVRIWHRPSQQLGSRHWPLYGFIYKSGAGLPAKAEKRGGKAERGSNADFIGDIIDGRAD